MLAELVKAGKLPAGREARARGAAGRQAGPRDRQVRRHLAPWLHRAGRRRERQPHRLDRQDPLLGLHRAPRSCPCVAKSWKISDDGRHDHDHAAQGPQVVGRRAVHRRRLHVLVRGHLPEQGPAARRRTRTSRSTASPGRSRRSTTTTVAFDFPEPYSLFVDILGGSTVHRRRPGHLADAGLHDGRLRAGALPQAVPPEVRRRRTRSTRWPRRRASTTGSSCIKNRWDWRLNPELPVLAPWKTVTPINTPTWTLERNPFYYGGRHRGQPAAVPRQDPDDAGREPGGAQPARHRRRVRPAGAPHRHSPSCRSSWRTAARATTTSSSTRRLNGSDATLQINQSYDADPEIAKWLQNRDFRHALSMGIDRDQLNETFWLGVGTPGSVAPDRDAALQPRPRVAQEVGRPLDVKQANALLDKIGLTRRTARATACAPTARAGCASSCTTSAGAFVPFPQIAEMIGQQWQEDRHPARRQGAGAQPRLHARSRNNEHQIVAVGERRLRAALPLPAPRPARRPGSKSLMGQPIANWYASNGEQGKAPEDPQMLEGARAVPLGRRPRRREERDKTAQEIWKIMVDERTRIGTVGLSPAVMGVRIVKNKMGNVPARQVNAQHCRTPLLVAPGDVLLQGLSSARLMLAIPGGAVLAGSSHCSRSGHLDPVVRHHPAAARRLRHAYIAQMSALGQRRLRSRRRRPCASSTASISRSTSSTCAGWAWWCAATSAWRWSGAARSPRSSATASG